LLAGLAVLGVLVVGIGAWAVMGQARPPTQPPTQAPTLPPATFGPSPIVTLEPETNDPGTFFPGPTFDFSQQPRVGFVQLAGGFTPDPYGTAVTPVREVDAGYLGQVGCRGMAGVAPDFRLIYEANGQPLLRFFVNGFADTALVVNDPNQTWFCNDDTAGLNPQIDFSAPIGGVYDIWVTDLSGAPDPATLIITGNPIMEPVGGS
jgi:hypothetical protein